MKIVLPVLNGEEELHRVHFCCDIVDGCDNFSPFSGKAEVSAELFLDFWSSEFRENENGVHIHLTYGKTPKRRKEPELLELEEVENEFSKFIGKTASGWISASWCIDLNSDKKSGIISAMLGIATQVDGEKVVMTGSKFSIGAAPFDELRWSLTEDEKLLVEIDYFQEFKVEDNILECHHGVLFQGMQKYGFGEIS